MCCFRKPLRDVLPFLECDANLHTNKRTTQCNIRAMKLTVSHSTKSAGSSLGISRAKISSDALTFSFGSSLGAPSLLEVPSTGSSGAATDGASGISVFTGASFTGSSWSSSSDSSVRSLIASSLLRPVCGSSCATSSTSSEGDGGGLVIRRPPLRADDRVRLGVEDSASSLNHSSGICCHSSSSSS